MILAFGFDRVLAFGLERWFSQVVIGKLEGGKINQAVKARAQAYVFGDSRAEHHYDPEILQSKLGMTFFNAGADGQDVLYFRMLADLIEQEHRPRLYLVNIDPEDLYPLNYRMQRLTVFAPYLGRSAAVDGIMLVRSIQLSRFTQKAWLFCHSYRYNGKGSLLLRQVFGEQPESVNGFVPLHQAYRDEKRTWSLQEKYDGYIVEQLGNFATQSVSKGIRVVFCTGPAFYRAQFGFNLRTDEWYLMKCIFQMSQMLKIPLIQILDRSRPEYQDSAFYSDLDHLNAQGAAVFSDDVVGHLVRVLQLKTMDEFVHSPYYPPFDPSDYPITMRSQR